MKFKAEDIRNLFQWENVEGFEVVEEGDWVDDGKYQSGEIIFKYQDKYYRKYASRSGSYFTHFEYDWNYWGEEVECEEVVPTQITKTIWERVVEVE